MGCAGDPTETCGGLYAFNAYQYTGQSPTPTPPTPTPPTPTPTPSDYEALDCYMDAKNSRVFGIDYTTNPDMTTEVSFDLGGY